MDTDDKQKTTYTKKMMNKIIFVALIDLQIPFILAFLDKVQIAETLGGLIVTEVIGVFLVYCTKSFFETKEEEKNLLKKMELKGGNSIEGEIDKQEVLDMPSSDVSVDSNEHQRSAFG